MAIIRGKRYKDRRKKGGERLMELAKESRRKANERKQLATNRANRLISGASPKTIKHGKTRITYKPTPSPHLKPKAEKPVVKPAEKPVAKQPVKKPAPKPVAKTTKKPISSKELAARVKKYGGISARKTGWKARLSDLKHHVLQKTIPATGRALESFEEDLGSLAHAIGLRKSDKPIRIANVPSTKKSATGLDVLTTLGGLGLGPVKKVKQLVTPARVLAEKGGKIKQTAAKIVPKEVKKFYQKHIGSRLSPKMQVTPTKGGTSLGTTTEITTRGLAFGAGTGASKVNKKIRSEARKAVARINKARTGRTGKKNPLTVAEFLKAVMNIKPKVVPKGRRLPLTPTTKPRVFNMPTAAKPKPKPTKEGPPKWQRAADKPKPTGKKPTGKKPTKPRITKVPRRKSAVKKAPAKKPAVKKAAAKKPATPKQAMQSLIDEVAGLRVGKGKPRIVPKKKPAAKKPAAKKKKK